MSAARPPILERRSFYRNDNTRTVTIVSLSVADIIVVHRRDLRRNAHQSVKGTP